MGDAALYTARRADCEHFVLPEMYKLIKNMLLLTLFQLIFGQPLTLGYNPNIRPFYAPRPIRYPEPFIPPGTPWPASRFPVTTHMPTTLTTPTLINEDTSITSGIPSKTTEHVPTTINLEYEVTRPSFLPHPVQYPAPVVVPKPHVDKNETSTDISITDSQNEEMTTTLTNKIPVDGNRITLGYKPTRPFYAPNPVFYPQYQPVKPTTSSPVTTTIKYEVTTEKINEETSFSFPDFLIDHFSSEPTTDPTIGPTTEPTKAPTEAPTVLTTVPSLSYVPSRPTFVPSPVVYPQPVIATNDTLSNDVTTPAAVITEITITETAMPATILTTAATVVEIKETTTNAPVSVKDDAQTLFTSRPIVIPQSTTVGNKPTVETQTVQTSTQNSVGTTTLSYNELLFNLQLLMEYIQAQNMSTSTSRSELNTNSPQASSTKPTFDINKISSALETLFTSNIITTTPSSLKQGNEIQT